MAGYAGQHAREGRWNETRAIQGLPFCALSLREFFDPDQRERTVYVLMEPAQVTEGNLHLLFRSISQRFADDQILRVWVDTEVEQLAFLATGQMMTVSPKQGPTDTNAKETEKKRVLQLAFYKRTESVELFRYNPNYPKSGESPLLSGVRRIEVECACQMTVRLTLYWFSVNVSFRQACVTLRLDYANLKRRIETERSLSPRIAR